MKKQPKYKQVKKSFRRPNGTFLSENEARTIARKARGKKVTKGLINEYFKDFKDTREKPARNNKGQIISNVERDEIKQAAKELGISFSKALAISQERKIVAEESDYRPMFEIEKELSGYLERNENLKIRIRHVGETRYRVFKGETGIIAAAEIMQEITQSILDQQNKERPKGTKKSTRIDSDRIPYIKIETERFAGSMTTQKISIDFNNVAQKGELESLRNLDFEDTDE